MKYNTKGKRIRQVLLKVKAARSLILIILLLSIMGCSKYLDVVPDNVATLDNAFTMRTEAEKYLFTCYSYLPADGDPGLNPAFLAGDECWLNENRNTLRYDMSYDSWNLGSGFQGINEPLCNYWDGAMSGKALFNGIRSCNTFLENVSDLNKVRDLKLDERTRWIGEVQFLKAYYNFVLLRMYGPIPIIDKNLPVSASQEAVRVRRMPVDSCVNYIAALLDSAAIKLPNTIQKTVLDLGRITRPIALSVKAKLLLMAASPLFNGNPDYQNFRDKQGVLLFSPANNVNKWQRAADAAKAAIVASEGAGFKLYYFTNPPYHLSDTTMTQMNIRNAVCEKWNTEVVWGNSNSQAYMLQVVSMANLNAAAVSSENRSVGKFFAPMKMAELFYSKNGVPINEDKTLDFSEKAKLRTATHDERYNIKEGYVTARLNFDRENRFYANLGFDGGVWYMYDTPSRSDNNTYVMQSKAGEFGNAYAGAYTSASGYFIKKLSAWESVYYPTVSIKNYPWPEVRLSDLYLMYAEALNEVSGPVDEVNSYLDLIRKRAGLPTVKDSWTNFSSNPVKFTTKDGMREIIHQERLIELAFEGSRFWDMQRWKKSSEFFNQPISGWSVTAMDAASYYQPRRIFQPTFVAPRDYFWPIKQYDLTVNPELVQNPGW